MESWHCPVELAGGGARCGAESAQVPRPHLLFRPEPPPRTPRSPGGLWERRSLHACCQGGTPQAAPLTAAFLSKHCPPAGTLVEPCLWVGGGGRGDPGVLLRAWPSPCPPGPELPAGLWATAGQELGLGSMGLESLKIRLCLVPGRGILFPDCSLYFLSVAVVFK